MVFVLPGETVFVTHMAAHSITVMSLATICFSKQYFLVSPPQLPTLFHINTHSCGESVHCSRP